jgi:hypothetical protein
MNTKQISGIPVLIDVVFHAIVLTGLAVGLATPFFYAQSQV